MSFDKDHYEQQHGTGRRADSDDEPFKLKATVQTYELTIAHLQQLFGEKLGVPASRITVTAKNRTVGDPLDRVPSTSVFDGLVITVKNA